MDKLRRALSGQEASDQDEERGGIITQVHCISYRFCVMGDEILHNLCLIQNFNFYQINHKTVVHYLSRHQITKHLQKFDMFCIPVLLNAVGDYCTHNVTDGSTHRLLYK